MKANRSLCGALVGLSLALIGMGPVLADAAADAAAAIEKADAARKKAASVGGEWRDTGKMLKQAKAAAKEGKDSDAIRLANEAYRQGELGYQQAMGQKGAGFPSYMR